jgi:hypothetical protein
MRVETGVREVADLFVKWVVLSKFPEEQCYKLNSYTTFVELG